MTKADVIILGAGAAGLMCAIRAGQRGRKVLILDHASEVGPKILISGGGRCNFTNRHIAPERFISNNPHFCISALKTYTQQHFVDLVEKHKIRYHEKALGQLFCDMSSRDVIAMLKAECDAAGVDIKLNHKITDISKGDQFTVQTDQGTFESSSLVLATGGLSIPKMGATGLTQETAKRFGLKITELRPGLVPLTFDGADLALLQSLTGIALEISASFGKHAFKENMVFTHRGLSGPAILQISSYWKQGDEIFINLLPSLDVEAYLLERKLGRPKAELQTVLGEILPQRLAQGLTSTYYSSVVTGTVTNKYLSDVAQFLKRWPLRPSGSEGYAKAEVTIGGVDTDDLSSKTMEAKSVKGLYVVGEGVDVTGWLGGYNFQWAWSSGWAAGSSV